MKYLFRPSNRYLSKTALIAAVCLLIFSVVAPRAHAQPDTAVGNVLFILDGSGSMWGQVEGKHKIVIAKDVMSSLVQELPANIRVGLQVYGHRSKGDCNDIEILIPVGSGDRQALIRQIETISPRGKTPITKAFQQAAEQLRLLGDETTVVLVSDGKETCEGDPCALVRQLRNQGIKIKVHVVGFDVTHDESEQLVCIADAGGGQYFSAENTDQLQQALTKIKQEVIAVAKPQQQPAEPSSKQTIIKTKRQATGTLAVINAYGTAGIIDKQTGKQITVIGSEQSKKLPAGPYTLKFSLYSANVEVMPGQKTVFDANTIAGWIISKIPLRPSGKVIDLQTGKQIATFTVDLPKQVRAGNYKLVLPLETIEVNIEPGQKVIIE